MGQRSWQAHSCCRQPEVFKAHGGTGVGGKVRSPGSRGQRLCHGGEDGGNGRRGVRGRPTCCTCCQQQLPQLKQLAVGCIEGDAGLFWWHSLARCCVQVLLLLLGYCSRHRCCQCCCSCRVALLRQQRRQRLRGQPPHRSWRGCRTALHHRGKCLGASSGVGSATGRAAATELAVVRGAEAGEQGKDGEQARVHAGGRRTGTSAPAAAASAAGPFQLLGSSRQLTHQEGMQLGKSVEEVGSRHALARGLRASRNQQGGRQGRSHPWSREPQLCSTPSCALLCSTNA